MTQSASAPTLDPRSLRTHARIAGLLYLVIIVAAGFAEGFVRSTLVVPGDPGATASNILGAQTLFRLGLFADLVAFSADAAVAVLLYVILRSAGPTIALLAVAFRLVAHPAIASLNLLNHLGALLVLDGGGPLAGFEPAELERLALLAMDLHGYGYVIGGLFFGIHLALLGHLLHRSELFPSLLGILIAAAAVGYLFEAFAVFVVPSLEGLAGSLVVVTASVGEVSLCLYLLIRGVRPVAPG